MTASASIQAGRSAAAGGTDLFVSYSRSDRDAMTALADRLRQRERSLWVDWEGIPPTAEWMAEIRAAIDAASGVLLVLSPSAATSRVCRDELEYALAAGKRIVPVVVQDVGPADLPETVRRLNWVFARREDDLDEAVAAIERGLDLDAEGVRLHTRLLVRAKDWQVSRQDAGRLLRGGELDDAERWLARSPLDPAPTAEQREFVLASRAGATRRQRRLLALVSVALVVALALGLFAYVQRNNALAAQRRATGLALSADSERLGVQALNVDDAKLGLLLAVQGYRLEDSAASQSNLLAALEQHDGKLFSASVGTTILDIARGPGDQLVVVDYRGAPYAWSTTTHVRAASVGPGGIIDSYFPGPGDRLALEQSKPNAQNGTVWVAVGDGTTPGEWHRLPGDVQSYPAPTWVGRKLLTPARGGPYADQPSTAVQLSDPDHPDRAPVVRDLGGYVNMLASAPTVAIAVTGDPPPLGGPTPGIRFVGRRVFVMDPSTLKIRGSFSLSSTDSVTAVAVSADGRHLALGYANGIVDLRGPDAPSFLSGKRSIELFDAGVVRRLAFSPDGSLLASGGESGDVMIHRTSDGVRTRDFALPGAVSGLTWDRVGYRLYASTYDGKLSGFDATPGHALALLVGGPLPIVEDGTAVATGDGSRAVTVGTNWNNTTWDSRLGTLVVATGATRQAVIMPDPYSSENSSLYANSRCPVVIDCYADLRVVLTGDGSTAVTIGQDGAVATRWDLRTMTRTAIVKSPLLSVPSPAHRPNDGIDPGIPADGLLHPASPDISDLVLAPDGRSIVYLMTAGSVQLLRGLNVQPFSVRGDVRLQSSAPDGRAWRPIGWADRDGRTLLAACGIGCIARIDTRSGAVTTVSDPQEARGTHGDGLAVLTTAISGDRTRAVEGVNDGTFRLFGGPGLTPVSPWTQTQSASIVSSTFTEDGALLVTGGKDGSLAFWRAQNGAPVASRFRVGFDSGAAITVATIPGGRVLALDRAGMVWSVPATVGGWTALACEIAGRNLTPSEWDTYLPDRPYQRTCP